MKFVCKIVRFAVLKYRKIYQIPWRKSFNRDIFSPLRCLCSINFTAIQAPLPALNQQCELPHDPNLSSTEKWRGAITDAERKAIRDHWAMADQKSHKAVQAWFTETHYHTISQSTVSEILSSRYDYLDKLSRATQQKRAKPALARP
jgi:hypothetical protein